MTSVVTLIVVIEQSFVTVVVMSASDVEPEATTLPRTATIQVHGAVAPVGTTVIETSDRFVAGVVADRRLRQVDEEVVGRDDRRGFVFVGRWCRGRHRGRGHGHDVDERHEQRDGRDKTRRDGPWRTAVMGSRVSVGHRTFGADDGRRSSGAVTAPWRPCPHRRDRSRAHVVGRREADCRSTPGLMHGVAVACRVGLGLGQRR